LSKKNNRKMKKKFASIQKAYSLIELSIVLVIISTLVAGALTISVDNLKNDQTRLTKERMDRVYKILGGYIRVNKSLPCPASLTKVKSVDSTDYGASGNCTTVSGVTAISTNYILGAVPTRTLGLPSEYAEDAFGSKIVYFVDKRFTTAATLNAAPNFGQTNFSTMANNQLSATPSNLWLIQSNPSGSRQDVTPNAVVGMVSAGQNKLGAYNARSSSANPTSSDADEATNSNGLASTMISSSPASNSFDDLVFYKTMKDIIADYPDIMYLVPCDNPNTTVAGEKYDQYINGSNTGDTWYDGIVYSKKGVCLSPNQDLRYSKKCGTNGNFTIQNESCSVIGTSTCSLTSNQDVGTGAKYTGTTQVYSNGSIVPLSCRANYGRKVIGGSRDSDNLSQTCSSSPTDRSTTATDFPQAICSNGTLYPINDCTVCVYCNLTKNQNVGENGAVYTGNTKAYSSGSIVPLSCRANYGHAIMKDSRSSNDSSKTCSATTTDRTNDAPSAACNNGNLSIYNDCSTCRNCSNSDSTSGTVFSDGNVLHEYSCNDDSRNASQIISACRGGGVTYNIPHTATAYFGHVQRRGCGNNCASRNLCNAATFRCIDGYFTYTGEQNGHELNSRLSCDTPVITCSSGSQSCNNN
jgi:prepilin-type N-terminal cleavage/methylation domain-containing protein